MPTLIRTLLPIMTLPAVTVTLPPLPRTAVKVVQVVIQPMVPMMDTGSGMHTVRLGASLRDRATLPSPLRGLDPSGGYPSRLRSLTLTARSACPAARCAPRRCRTDTLGASFDRTVRGTAVSSSRRRCAPRSSQSSPRSPFAGCAGSRHRPGSVRQHSVRRR